MKNFFLFLFENLLIAFFLFLGLFVGAKLTLLSQFILLMMAMVLFFGRKEILDDNNELDFLAKCGRSYNFAVFLSGCLVGDVFYIIYCIISNEPIKNFFILFFR